MAITDIINLKNWFKKGKKPTQEQFYAIFDSFRHKSEKIPTNDVEGLQEALDNKQDKLIAGKTIRNVVVNNQTIPLLGSGTLYIDAGIYFSSTHRFGLDNPYYDSELIDQGTVQGELDNLSLGYTHFGQARLLQLTIRFRILDDIQGLVFCREPFGYQITNDFGNSFCPGVVIARVTNGHATELVEVEDALIAHQYGFRVTTPSDIRGSKCSLTVFMYGCLG